MDEFARRESPLPGLDPPVAGESELELAARRTIAALEADGLLEERHALTCQLMLDLAASVDAGRRQGRASAVAMAAAQLREAYLTLPVLEGGDTNDEWSKLASDLRQAANRARETALRDTGGSHPGQ